MNRTTLALTLVTVSAVFAGCADTVPPDTRIGPTAASVTATPTASPTGSPVAAAAPSTPPASPSVVAAPSWAVTGSMHDFRDSPGTTTLLADGRVLVAGGHGSGPRHDPAARSAELYDPTSGQWTETGRMVTAHLSGHTATLLPSGQVLVAGGRTYQKPGLAPFAQDRAELYDPLTGTWRATGRMTVARTGHLATLLPDGTVLVVGGIGANWKTVRRAEVYDPATGTWARTRSMQLRGALTSLVSGGRVLVVGRPSGSRVVPVEAYDPASRGWTLVALASGADYLSRAAVRLGDDRVLVLCGSVFDERAKSAYLLDPATGSLTTTAAPLRRFRNAVLLADGRVLVNDIGPGELYDPTSGTWTTAGLPTYPDDRLPGFRMTVSNDTWWYEVDSATRLLDGRVLLTIASKALLYDADDSPG